MDKISKFIVLFYMIGLIGHLIPFTRDFFLLLTPVSLLTFLLILLVDFYKKNDQKILLWILITYILTFAIEVIGAKTGMVFGVYKYGNTLGFKVFEVPVVIGLNWVFIILGAVNIVQKKINSKLLIAFFVGLISTIFDIFLEPVAIKFDYWTWENNIIPLQNYIAWFVISFVFTLFYLYFVKSRKDNSSVQIYFVVQTIFFVLLNLLV